MIIRYILIIVITLCFLFFEFLLNVNFLPFPAVIPNKNIFFIHMVIYCGFFLISLPCFLYSLYSCLKKENLRNKVKSFFKILVLLNLSLIFVAYLLFRLLNLIFGDNGI